MLLLSLIKHLLIGADDVQGAVEAPRRSNRAAQDAVHEGRE